MNTEDTLPFDNARVRFSRTGSSFRLEGRVPELQPLTAAIKKLGPDLGCLTVPAPDPNEGAASASRGGRAPDGAEATARVFRTARNEYVLSIKGVKRATHLREVAATIQSPTDLIGSRFLEALSQARRDRLSEVTVSLDRAEAGDAPSPKAQAIHTSLAAWVESLAPTAELGLEANARRLAERRAQIIDQCPTIEPEVLARSLGSSAGEPRAFLQRLRNESKVLAYKAGKGFRYPAFQFDEAGEIASNMQTLLLQGRALGWPAHGDMHMMLWLHSAEPGLKGARPLDRLTSDPHAVVVAFSQRFPSAGAGS
jgi:hypothetical protein